MGKRGGWFWWGGRMCFLFCGMGFLGGFGSLGYVTSWDSLGFFVVLGGSLGVLLGEWFWFFMGRAFLHSFV